MRLNKEQRAKRERTLLVALLLASWSPLAMGISLFFGQSTTQLADFIRRSVELLALFVSWLIFRIISRANPSPQAEAKLERWAGLGVAIALACSGLVMMVLAISRLNTFQPGGNVYPGIIFAAMGLVTNAFFWRRYSLLDREQSSTIISAQIVLYRAKCLVGLCVILALAAVAVNPTHILTHWIDILGTIIVACYLLWSGYRSARRANSVLIPVASGQREAN